MSGGRNLRGPEDETMLDRDMTKIPEGVIWPAVTLNEEEIEQFRKEWGTATHCPPEDEAMKDHAVRDMTDEEKKAGIPPAFETAPRTVKLMKLEEPRREREDGPADTPELPALEKVIVRFTMLTEDLGELDARFRLTNDLFWGCLPELKGEMADKMSSSILDRLNGCIDLCVEKVLALRRELRRYEEAVGATTK